MVAKSVLEVAIIEEMKWRRQLFITIGILYVIEVALLFKFQHNNLNIRESPAFTAVVRQI